MRIAEEEKVLVESANGVEFAKVADFSASGARLELDPEVTYRIEDPIKLCYQGAWMHARVIRVSTSREITSVGIEWQDAKQSVAAG